MNREDFIKTLSNFLKKRDLVLCRYAYLELGEGKELDSLLYNEFIGEVESYFKEVDNDN